MTLLDAPQFDAVKARRRERSFYAALGVLFLLFVLYWLMAGRPVAWPWQWHTHMMGRATANHFLDAVEKNDLETAFGIWLHDPKWKQHPPTGYYTYERFLRDWSPDSHVNDFGVIHSHKIAAARVYGDGLLMSILLNGRKSRPISFIYDPPTHQLNFAPEGVELYLGP